MSILKRLFPKLYPEPVREALKPATKPAPSKEDIDPLVQATQRHGKVFHTHSNVPRVAERSDLLKKLDLKSEAAEGKTIVVTDISSRRKS